MGKNTTVGRYVAYPAIGGLETISIPGTQTPGRLTSGMNFMIDLNGAKRKHPGISRRQDRSGVVTAGNTRGLFDTWRTNVSVKEQQTVAVTGGKVYADDSDGIYADKTGAFVLSTTDNVYMEMFFGLLILAFDNNPSSVPLKYDQTTLAALGGTPPNFRYLRTFQNRLWGTGNPAAPDRVYASGIGNPEDWDTVASTALNIDIDLGDQDPVGNTSLFPPLFGRMIVGKRRALWELTPVSTTFAVSSVVNGIGSVSHNAVAAADNDIVFVSERGVHSLMMTDKFGQVETGFLSYPIQDYMQDNIDFKRSGNMRSIYSPELNTYFLSCTRKGSYRNDLVLGYNMIHKEWFMFEENVAAMTRYVDNQDGNKTKILVADDLGRIGIMDASKNDRIVTWFGDRRTTTFTTGLIIPINLATEVNFSKLTCFYKPQTTGSAFTVSYYVDGSLVDTVEFLMDPASGSLIGSATIGSAVIGGRGILRQGTRQLKGLGRTIELVFTHTPSSDEEDFELYGYIVEYEYAGETEQAKTQ